LAISGSPPEAAAAIRAAAAFASILPPIKRKTFNVKTLDILLFSVTSVGPICCTPSPSYFPSFGGFSRYSPSYIDYFTHFARRTGVAILMFIGDQLKNRIH